MRSHSICIATSHNISQNQVIQLNVFIQKHIVTYNENSVSLISSYLHFNLFCSCFYFRFWMDRKPNPNVFKFQIVLELFSEINYCNIQERYWMLQYFVCAALDRSISCTISQLTMGLHLHSEPAKCWFTFDHLEKLRKRLPNAGHILVVFNLLWL